MIDYKKALELKQEGKPLKEIMEELNIDVKYKTFQRALYEYEKTGHERNIRVKNNIEFLDRKEEPQECDLQEYYEGLKQLERSMDKLDRKQTKAEITINDDKPIGIAFWGDWHLGSRGLDYGQFDNDRETIKATDGLYFIGMGDYKDNNSAYVTKSSNENSISQSMQDLLVCKMMEEVKEKVIALIRGCHDDWDKKLGDKDFTEELCRITDSINLWHGGKVTINLGDETYKIFARHKYKNESSLNTTNAQRNMLNDSGAVDVAALGHKHFPDMQMLDRMGQKVIYIRSGSYKKYDEFGQKLAGYEGKKSVPLVVIFPNEHKVVPFQELEDGITYLKAVRK